MHEFRLADLGEGMHEAEVLQWLVEPGDTVKLDQPLLRVETDKAMVEIPAPVAGRVSRILIPNGKTASVGEVLVTFDENGSRTSDEASARRPEAIKNTETFLNGTAPEQISSKRVLASPAVRKQAFEMGIDLEKVTSSLPGGRISLEDLRAYTEKSRSAWTVEQAVSSPASPLRTEPPIPTTTPRVQSNPKDERQSLTGLRRRIAEHMERSWRTVPHATAFDEIDGGALIALREALLPIAKEQGVRLSYMPLLIKLLIPVLKEFPIFNASLDEERREIIYRRSYHIGLATASPEGLLVPVIRDADKLTLLELAREIERLVIGGRERRLLPRELSGSTFTLNNVGSYGGSSGTPIINYPEVAILAVGRLQEKAVARQGQIVVKSMMPLALSFDHRLIDGVAAGEFMKRFQSLVENPQQLLLNMI